MRISIRFKLLIYMTANIFLFAILLVGTNVFFAEKYYIHNKKNTLIKTGEELTELISGRESQSDFDDKELIYAINKLEKSIGGTIVIGTMEKGLYFPQNNGSDRLFMDSLMTYDSFLKLPPDTYKNWEPYNSNSVFIYTKDPGLEIKTLRYQIQQENGLVLVIWVPMAEISENASLSNNLTAFIGFITILITGIIAFFISGRFTKPMKEINRITKKMSNLDFSQGLSIKSKDELGELSELINQLSCSLDDAITELNDRNEQLEHDILHERTLDLMRRQFVSNVSHELKTPLFLIEGYAEGLKANVIQSDDKKEFYCDVIMEECDKMNRLIKDLLDLSHIESGMFTIQKEHCNLSNLIGSVITKYNQIFKEKKINLTTSIEENLYVCADSVRLEQVLVNFINNAIDYSDHNKVIQISLQIIDSGIRLSVYNSGPSISKDELEKIWTSFYKVDRARSRSIGGTGLGLSIVRAILEAHGSEYGVSNADGGVVFWFEFPVTSF